jgi:hypothetical protein
MGHELTEVYKGNKSAYTQKSILLSLDCNVTGEGHFRNEAVAATQLAESLARV